MTRRCSRREQGSSLVLVLAFMALAVPLVTAALGLASTLSVDSGIKTRILKSQYSALGGAEHAVYRLIYETGYADSLTVGYPDSYSITLNGTPVIITVEKFSTPPSNLPPPNADSSRRLQTSKTVTPNTAPVFTETTFTYTVTVENRDNDPENVRKIHDVLPPGFTYVAGSTSGVTTDEPSISGQQLTWNLATLSINLQPGQSIQLVFRARANAGQGNYCNEAWAEPGDDKTSTGPTVKVTVGSPSDGLCQGAAAMLTKTVTPNRVSAFAATTYTYTMTLQSVGTDILNMSLIRDYLPSGFSYVTGSTSGVTTAEPTGTQWQGRQRLDWSFSPKHQVQPGGTMTLTFQAQATAAPGEYWNEAWVTVDEFTNPLYTWPTAKVQVMAVFTAGASDGQSTANLELWSLPGSYAISQFEITR
ncbi:MAG: isopeptide-forming domain-containing fimbrial protein [Chloroflexi bacterium]|nr:isopeptide-forming domain-containing fimbrial protein [Chloroflexota bacterium]